MQSSALFLGTMLAAGLLLLVIVFKARRAARSKSGPAPEARFRVLVSATEVICHKPNGRIDRLALAELKEVYLVTTSQGPFGRESWWSLKGGGEKGGLTFPGGATGEEAFVRHVQKLPGFDERSFKEARGSTNEGQFLCWRAG